MPQLQILQAVRINAIAQAIQDVRELPAQLTFLNRTAVVPAFDGEIMGRYVGRTQIADLVADDAAAVTYVQGKMTLETNNAPNIKHGTQLTQEQINQLLAIQTAGSIAADGGIWSHFENRTIASLLLGIQQRMEALICAMKCDSLTYNRLGIQLAGITWGMPADLKVTVATAWTDAANATPVSDTLTLKRTASTRYGVVFRRMTFSLTAFLDMIATTEFQTRSRTFLAPNVSYVNLPVQNTDYMQILAANVMGLTIEIYDQRYWSADVSGVQTSTAFLPINKVILDAPELDNNDMASDFANGIVTESVVAGLVPGNILGRIGGPTRGPISYATADADMNPPNVTYWAVARGFPRRHLLQGNAVMTIGNLVDTIPVGEPF